MIVPDLNLLRVFDVMLEERSATRAGARLGLTQSAVSHALNRLRYALKDELFVRGPTGMQPTPRAVEIGPQVHAALNQLQAAITPGDFNAATSERRFTVATGAYGAAVMAPALANRLAQAAPMVELVVAEYSTDALDLLDARRVDFLIGGVVAGPERLAQDRLLTESLVWIARIDGPLARQDPIDLKALVQVPHVVIARPFADPAAEASTRRGMVLRASWEDAGALEAALDERGLTRRVGVIVPDTYTAIAVAARSDMAALAPRRLAQLSAQSGRVMLIEPPYASPGVQVNLVYLRDRLAEPSITWMRDLIRSVAAEI